MHRHIGIYPGTFDPVHEGHIAFANEGVKLFHLEKVVFLPEKSPRKKQSVTDISTRHAELSSSLAAHPKLESLVLHTDQFTVLETLPELHRLFQGSKFTFFIGSDVALHLPHWKDLPLLLADTSFVVAIREGESEVQVQEVLKALEKSINMTVRYTIIDSPKPALRSSVIKKSQGAVSSDGAR